MLNLPTAKHTSKNTVNIYEKFPITNCVASLLWPKHRFEIEPKLVREKILANIVCSKYHSQQTFNVAIGTPSLIVSYTTKQSANVALG